MAARTFRVIDPSGLHARPAAQLVKAMHAAGAQGTLSKGDRVADVGSILEILGLGIDNGDVIVLDVNQEAESVFASLEHLLEPLTDDTPR
ncbi:MAG: HPr family phosphocarrier protein [Ferrimicrobium sp.]|uniref:HPr family phosphocarrier protein n=1 Tax=Ferrimicrobium sp. TaxID=2926050 RepID=UPI00262DD482|nr:HPr family phosphocarrier protein [Ferrimicrobium sp.]